jgi:hypothetical protein
VLKDRSQAKQNQNSYWFPESLEKNQTNNWIYFATISEIIFKYTFCLRSNVVYFGKLENREKGKNFVYSRR